MSQVFACTYIVASASSVLAIAAPVQAQLKIDFNASPPSTQLTESGFTAFTRADSGSSIDGVTVTLIDSGFDDRVRTLGDNGAFTFADLYADFLFLSTSGLLATRDVLALDGLEPGGEYNVKLYSYDAVFGSGATTDWIANGDPLVTATFDNTVELTSNDQFAFIGRAFADANGRLLLQATEVFAPEGAAVYLNGLEVTLIPTPSATALLALGGVAVLRRRRIG